MFVVQEQFWFRKQTHKVTQQSQGQAISTHTYTHTPTHQRTRQQGVKCKPSIFATFNLIYNLPSLLSSQHTWGSVRLKMRTTGVIQK